MILKFFNLYLFFLFIVINPALAQVESDSTKSLSTSDKELVEVETAEARNKRFFRRGVIPSMALIAAGGAGIFIKQDVFDFRSKTFPNFSTDADDFAMLAPLAGMYAINFFSSSNRHELGRQTLLLISSGVLTSAMVWPTKKFTGVDRPNGKPYAFPSGHTAYAFTIATFMDKEFRHRRPWISVVSYTIASATGVVRILNNAHWISDVLTGAGVGILSVNTVYWLHSKIARNKKLNTSIVPVLLPGGNMGMCLTLKF